MNRPLHADLLGKPLAIRSIGRGLGKLLVLLERLVDFCVISREQKRCIGLGSSGRRRRFLRETSDCQESSLLFAERGAAIAQVTLVPLRRSLYALGIERRMTPTVNRDGGRLRQ